MVPRRQIKRFIAAVIGAGFVVAAVFPAFGATGVNAQFNYQGKLLDLAGAAVFDGAQNFVFKLYAVPSGGTALWTETWSEATRFTSTLSSAASAGATTLYYVDDVSEANLRVGDVLYSTATSDEAVITAFDTSANTITVSPLARDWAAGGGITTRIVTRSGYFTARLGSIISLASMDFNQDILYMGVAVGSDSEMTPRKRITSVAQAMNAQSLGGATSTQFLRSDTSTALSVSSTNPALTLTQGAGTNAGPALKVASAPAANSAASLLQLSANAISGGSANGTFLAANPASFNGDFINFQTGNAEQFRVSATGSAYFAGNVGIGTTSPAQQKLDVNGNIYARETNHFIVDGGAGLVDSLWASKIGLGNTNGIQFFTNGLSNERVRIDNNGNVGIGTPAPGTKLVISGSGNQTLTIDSTNSWSPTIALNQSGATEWSILAGNGDDYVINDKLGNTKFLIDQTTGNVGIGTTNPVVKLDVYSTTVGQSAFSVRGAQGGVVSIDEWGNLFTPFGNIDWDSNVGTGAFTNPGNTYITSGNGQANPTNIILKPSGTGNIQLNGNVGIGTNPSSILHISATAPVLRLYDTGSGGSRFQFGSSGAASSEITDNFGIAGLEFRTGAGSMATRMAITSTGNVGIGTTAPSSMLFVQGTSTTPLLNITASSSASALYVSNTGNVGIGTASPAAMLTIAGGNILLSNSKSIGFYANNNTNIENVLSYDSGNSLNFNQPLNATSNPINFQIGGTSIMTIQPTGSGNNANVGIGTTSPAAALNVLSTGDQLRLSYDASHYAVIDSYSDGNMSIIPSGNAINLGDSARGKTLNFWQQSNGTLGNTAAIRADWNNLYLTNGNGQVVVENATSEGQALSIQEAGSPWGRLTWWYDGSSAGGTGMWMHTGTNAGSMNFQLGESAGASNFNVMDLAKNVLFKVNSLGNVGIGTASPSQKLSVNGVIETLNPSDNVENIHIYSDNSASNMSWYTDASQSTFKALRFVSFNNSNAISGIERMRIDGTGNVGIGTTAPTSKLTLQGGEAAFTIAGTATTTISSATSTFAGGLNVMSGKLFVQEGSGNVGIGTTSPTNRLHIHSDTASGIKIERSTANNNSNIQYTNPGGSMFAGLSGNSDFGIGSSVDLATAYLTVLKTGNVGIGTTSPNANLAVQTTATINDGVFINASSVTDGNGLRIEVNGANMNNGLALSVTRDGVNKFAIDEWGTTKAYMYKADDGTASVPTFTFTNDINTGLYSGGADIMRMVTGGLDRMSIIANGNVGIGTMSPQYKLEVAGAASTTLLYLPATASSTAGVIYQGADPVFHTYGNQNLFIGQNSGNFSTSGTGQNVGLGYYTLNALTTGSGNTAIGANTLKVTTTGYNNMAVGSGALAANVDGNTNTAIGSCALCNNVSGSSNTAIGAYALNNSIATGNLAIGRAAMWLNTSGGNNTALGTYALGSTTTGTNNIAIGYNAGYDLVSGSNNIVIGYNTDLPATTTSNTLDIGNLIYATGLTNFGSVSSALSTGNVGIGTTNPLAMLDVRGTIENGLTAWWPMDEGSGTTLTDQSINNNTVSLAGVSWVSGKSGKALEFDGSTSDYAIATDIGLLDNLPQMSFEVWFKLDQLSSTRGFEQEVFSKMLINPPYTNSYSLFVWTDNSLLFHLVNSSGSEIYLGGGNVQTNTWYHAVATYDGSNVKLYLNGILVDTKSLTGNVFDSDGPLTIGTLYAGANSLDGTIDDFKIYNRALSKREVEEHYLYTPSFSQGGTVSGNLSVTGNVGIGTNNPSSKLTLQGGEAAFTIAGTATTTISSATSTFAGGLNVMSGKLFVQEGSGNVGIGTTGPAANLNVYQSASGTDAFVVDSYNGGGRAQWKINEWGDMSSPGGLILAYDSNVNAHAYGSFGDLYLTSGNGSGLSKNIIIKPSGTGNVGIGTTNPLQTLDMKAGGAYGYNGQVMAQASTTLNNWFFGGAGNLTMTGNDNMAIGSGALDADTTGYRNVAIGTNALTANTTGYLNTAIGYNALQSHNQNNGYNIAIGSNSLYTSSSGAMNTAIGYGALYYLVGGNSNTAIGMYAGQNTTGTGNVYIGNYAGSKQAAVSNKLLIGNQDYADAATELTNSIIYGVMAATPADQTLTFNTGNVLIPTGNVGIGTTNLNSNYAFTVNGYSAFGDSDNGIVLGKETGYADVIGVDVLGNAYNDIHFRTSATAGLVLTTAGNVGIGTTSPSAGLHVATNGAASTPAVKLDGTWYTGGTAVTTQPQLLIQPSGTTAVNWLTTGTGLGINAANGFAGMLADFRVNDSRKFFVDSVGIIGTVAGIQNLSSENNAYINMPQSGVQISRNTADANPSLVVIQASAGSTGDILDLQVAGGVTKVAFLQNGNVGIGTTTPDSNLNIYSTTAQNAMVVRSNDGSTWSIGQYGNLYSSNGPEIAWDSNVSHYAYTSNDVNYITSGMGSASANNILLMPSGTGKVGIGTTAPSSMLFVQGTSTTPLLNITASSSASALYVSNTGNVGIGTTSPSAKLQVEGTVGGGYNFLTMASGRVTVDQWGNLFANGIGMAWDSNVSSSALTTAAQNLYLTTDGGSTGNHNIILKPQGTGNIQLNGNVGIGTTTPDSNLNIYSTTAQNALTVRANDDNTWKIDQWSNLVSSYGMTMGWDANVYNGAYSGSGNTYITSGIGQATAYNIILKPSGTGNIGIGTTAPTSKLTLQGGEAAFTITGTATTTISSATSTFAGGLNVMSGKLFVQEGSGNVGIGTASPSLPLTVNSGSSFDIAKFIAPTSGTRGDITVAGQYAGQINLLDVNTHLYGEGSLLTAFGYKGVSMGINGGEVARFGKDGTDYTSYFNGNVGIGSISPTAMLFVQGTSTTPLLNITASSSASALYVSNTGNVGIGTTSPAYNLEVRGTNGTSIIKITGGTDAPSDSGYLNVNNRALFGYDGANVAITDNVFGKDIVFSNSGAERMRILSSNGNVGIGTTTPAGQLHVSSTGFSTTGVRVTVNSGGTAADASAFLIENSAGTHLFRVNATGTVFSASNYNCALGANCYVSNQAADLAELTAVVGFPSNYRVGDLVRQSEQARKVEKTKEAYDGGIYGVITDRGQFLGKATGLEEGMNAVKVAIAGYVQARVSVASGNILPGDYLTASDDPGIAMKATKAGRVIGIAREAYAEGGVGLIEIVAQPTHWMGPDSAISSVEGVSALPGDVSDLSPAVVTVTRQILPPGASDFFLANVIRPLKALGIEIGQGVIKVVRVVAEVVETRLLKTDVAQVQKLEMTDQLTGAIYCTWIAAGEWVKVPGSCDGVSTVPAPTTMPQPSPSFDNAQNDQNKPIEEGVAPSHSPIYDNNAATLSPEPSPLGENTLDGSAESGTIPSVSVEPSPSPAVLPEATSANYIIN